MILEIKPWATTVELPENQELGAWPEKITLTKFEMNARGEKRIAEEQSYVIDRPRKKRRWSDPTVPR